MNRKFISLSFLALSMFIISTASAGITLENAFVSRYIWRGFDLIDNKAAAQPSITFTDDKTGIFFNFWNSTGLNRDATKSADELDFAVGYSAHISDLVELSVGYIYYTFPNARTPNISHEFNAGLSFGTILSPSVTAYYDANMGNGLYILGSVSQGIGPVSVGIAGGYNREQYIEDSGITDVTFSISVDIPLPYKKMYLSPSLNYTIIPENMQGKDGLSDENEVWFTIGFGIEF